MNLLLDTNVLLWALTSPNRLSTAAAEAIEDVENRVYVSVVSPWELSIKTSRGNLPVLDGLGPKMDEMSFDLLPIALSHTKAIESLPHHHRDPFDRMLVAQAQIEGLTIVTSDRQMRRYPVAVLPAI